MTEIGIIARQAFADHRLSRRGPGWSWRMARPGTGIYSFRVTWAPGVLVVSGDIGDATYRIWPSAATLWGAIELVHRAGYDYLTGKSTAKTEFDREATVRSLLHHADEAMRWGDFTAWELIVEHYHGSAGFRYTDQHGRRVMEWLVNPRSAAVQMRAAAALREDYDLTAERVYEITDDFEAPRYSYPSETRWTYEALQLWASAMLAAEPRWHRLWRAAKRLRRRIAGYRHYPVVWRPAFFWHDPDGRNGHFSRCSRPHIYVRVQRRDYDGKPFTWNAEVKPWVLFGRDLSRWGFYRCTGSGNGSANELLPCPPGVRPVAGY